MTTRPELRGTHGAVSATHWLAAQAGLAALERGNAFDAAVTAGFVLQVVEPHLNGLGGEVPILLWDARHGRVEVICGQGPAPAAASVARMAAEGVAQVPGSGLLAATVPGAFGGWLALLRDHGTLRLRDVLEPAISYAENGYPLLPSAARMIAAMEQLFLRDWPTSAAVYVASGLPGSVFRNRDLADTYRRLLEAGEAAAGDRVAQIEAALDAFYGGFVADAIDKHCRRPVPDSSGASHAGFLTGEDLAGWRALHEEPVTAAFRGWSVAKCGSWSQGPVFLQQLLQLGDLEAEFLSAGQIHLVVENAKLAFADREAWYADPVLADVPLGLLLSDAYAAERRRLVSERASLELRPGGDQPRLPVWAGQEVADGHWTGAGVQAQGVLQRDTCHVCAADRFGNIVACTPSGGWLQSSPVIEGLGFCLGTRAQMLNLDPSHPNRLEGGKRPRTTLSPTLALFGGEPRLAFGTPGGDQQDQWTLEFFLAHAVYGLDLQAALDAPMFHTEHFPSSFAPHEALPGRVLVEDRVGPATLDDLRARGHDVRVVDGWSLGRTCAVSLDPATGLIGAGANARGGQAYAAVR